MTEQLPSSRRIFLLLMTAYVVGTACAVNNRADYCISITIILALFLIYARSRVARLSLRSWASISLIPLVAFGYTSWRTGLRHDQPLDKYAGRSAIILGEVTEKLPSSTANHTNYLMNVNKIVFPETKVLHAKVLLCVRTDSSSEASGLPLKEPLMAKVSLKTPAISPQELFNSTPAVNNNNNNSHGNSHGKLLCCCTQHDVTAYPATATTEENILEKLIEDARQTIVQAHVKSLSNAEGCLLSSMVLGDKAIKLPDAIVNDFRAIGLSHILAASGFNLTLVITMSYFIASCLLPTERQRAIFTLILMTAFVLLAGLSASIVRAAIMCTFVIASRVAGRKPHITACIAIALVITILADPTSISDLGLQLSYAATIGITAGAQPLCDLIQIRPSRACRMLAELTSVCLVAQLSVLPIQVFAFWNANLLFLASNLLILPLVGPITIVGFVSSLLALSSVVAKITPALPALGQLTQLACDKFDGVIQLPLSYMLALSHYLASIQWAKLHVGQPSLLQVFAYYFCFCIFLIALRRQWHSLLILILPIAGISVLFLRPEAPALSIGVFSTGTVLINGERDAVILPTLEECSDDKIVNKYLAYNAVRNSVVVSHSSASNHALTAKSQNTFSTYADSANQVGAVYVSEPDNLRPTLAQAQNCLGCLQRTKIRYLILRCDRDKNNWAKHQPEKIFKEARILMAACGLDRAILVFGHRQFLDVQPFLRAMRSDSSATTALASITATNGLQAVSIGKDQMASSSY